jgi:hypothetical protein
LNEDKVLIDKHDLIWLISMTDGYIEDENLSYKYNRRLLEIRGKYGIIELHESDKEVIN